jgi:hypothetical protein
MDGRVLPEGKRHEIQASASFVNAAQTRMDVRDLMIT